MKASSNTFGDLPWIRAVNNWFARHENDVLTLSFTAAPPFVTLNFKKLTEREKSRKWKPVAFFVNIWNERITPAGRWIIAGAVGSVIAGSSPEPEVGRYLFSFFISLIGTALIISLIRTPKVSVKRWIATRFPAKTPVPLVMNIKNTGTEPEADVGAYEYRLPTGLTITQPPAFIEELPAGAQAAQQYTLTAAARGSYLITGPAVISVFPFGLSQSRQFKPDPVHVFVHPQFKPIKTLDLPASTRHQPGGIALSSDVGESMEFIGTREYQTGDRIRHIHPRSWARVGIPVVRQFQEEYFTRVALIADTFVPGTQDLQSFEAQLSLIAGITDNLSREEYVLDLFAIGDKIIDFESGRSLAYQDQVLETLAIVEPSETDKIGQLSQAIEDQLRVTSTIIVVLLRWDKPRRELIEKVIASGVMVKVVLVTSQTPAQNDVIGHSFTWLTPEQVEHGVDKL